MSSIREQLESYDRGVGKRMKGFRLGATIDTARLSKLGCGGRCMKWYVKGLSVFFVICGIIILATASYAANDLELIQVIGNDFTTAILAVGAFLLVLGTLGIAGSLNESKLILSIFALVMVLLTVAMLAIAGWAINNSKDPTGILGKGWSAMSNDARVHVQYAYMCCGANWGWSPNYNAQLPGEPCPMEGNPMHPMSQPCIPLLVNDFKNVYVGFGATVLAIGLLMVSGIVSACCMMKSITAADEAARKPVSQDDDYA